MTEEVKEGIEEMQANVDALKGVETVVVEAAGEDTDEEHEYTATETKAMEKGWNPDKESLGDKEWISAGEFMRNDRLFVEIKKLKRENAATKREQQALIEHHKKVKVAERDKLLSQLKRQKKTAMEEDDHDMVIEIDEQILDVKASENEPDAIEAQENDNTAFLGWVEDNDWYESNQEMRKTADEIAAAYYSRTQGKGSPLDMFEYVEGRIKKLYADQFSPKPAAKRKVTPSVEGAGAGRAASGASKAPKYTVKDLNDEQRRVMNTFVKSGALTKQEYIDELVAIGDIG